MRLTSCSERARPTVSRDDCWQISLMTGMVDVFAGAGHLQPSVILIDEID